VNLLRTWLKELRESKRMTQAEMANGLGITQQFYCMIEKGERKNDMTIGFVKKLSEVLDVPIGMILDMENAR
jgi:transcriptional regulator with XRE-family HTH domain